MADTHEFYNHFAHCRQCNLVTNHDIFGRVENGVSITTHVCNRCNIAVKKVAYL
jgi:hypothetical protein